MSFFELTIPDMINLCKKLGGGCRRRRKQVQRKNKMCQARREQGRDKNATLYIRVIKSGREFAASHSRSIDVLINVSIVQPAMSLSGVILFETYRDRLSKPTQKAR